jgi:hypothetical protein
MKKLSTLLVCLLVSIAAFGQFEWVFDNYIPPLASDVRWCGAVPRTHLPKGCVLYKAKK